MRLGRLVREAQGGDPKSLDKFELLPNATGMRDISSLRAGYVTAIDAEDIGAASGLMGASRDKKEDKIDPAVGVILEAKIGDKVEAGSVLCRLYYTREEGVDEAADMVEDAFRISSQKPDERAPVRDRSPLGDRLRRELSYNLMIRHHKAKQEIIVRE